MRAILGAPAPAYSLLDQTAFRRALENVFARVAALTDLGVDEALTFAELPTSPSTGQRYFVTDRGTNGKPLWWNGTAWVDASSTIVT